MEADPQRSDETHESIVEDWRQNAERHDDDNFAFLRSLKSHDDCDKVDEVANQLHEQAFQIVDCTRCANCCKTLQIQLDDKDIRRISDHLKKTTDEFADEYLEQNEEGAFRIRTKPCPFLGEDDRCTIYDIRPTVCREYPYTNKEGLVFRTMGIANSALTCPAVYWVVEQMRKQNS